jgi:transposase
MLRMAKRHQVQVLRDAGHTQAAVAAATGASRRSVQRVEAEPRVTSFDDVAERARRGVGRPSLVEPLRGFIAGQLKDEPELLGVELLRRAQQKGYQGAKSALYSLVRELRVTPVEAVIRFEGLPGEFSQHDFGEVDVRFDDGRVRRVHFFASRLKYSRTAAVSIVPDQRVESLVRSLVAHLDSFGGVPLAMVFDRPKTVALEWNRRGEVTRWNAVFADVMVSLGGVAEVCWPRRPQEKGAVENLVGWVKGSFFKQRRFVDDEDLAAQLAQWHVEVNTKRPSRATKVVPSVRLAEERPLLKPLRIRPSELVLRLPVVVGAEGLVVHEARTYSMPPQARGKAGTLYLGEASVRIVVGKHVAVHRRLRGAERSSMLPDHRAAHVDAARGARGRLYAQREQLRRLGPAVERLLTELVHRRPGAWSRDVEHLYELLLRHGDAAFLGAVEQSAVSGVCGAEYVAHFVAATSQEVAR